MEKEILILTKSVIEAKLYGKKVVSKEEIVKTYPIFALEKATFVTLKIDGKLRGCIGSLVAHRELYDDLTSNALGAAFSDPRFSPLSKDEFDNVDVEISLLSDAKIVTYENIEDLKSKIRVGIDGVILIRNHKQATFLPQVWEEIPDFDSFFEHLCAKAGLDQNALELHPDIYTYEVKKIKEDDFL